MTTENIRVITHSCIRIEGTQTIYFDPYDLTEETHDADMIFVSHEHYDHFDPKSIALIARGNTLLIAPASCREKILAESGISEDWCEFMEPGEELEIDEIAIEAVPAYNIGKQFHTRDKNWLGFKVCMDDTAYYYTGDSDATDEAAAVSCDVLFVPIGGKYTMNVAEAAELTARILPQVAIPTHYGNIIGRPSDAADFDAAVSELAPAVAVIPKEERFKEQ